MTMTRMVAWKIKTKEKYMFKRIKLNQLLAGKKNKRI